MIEAPLRADDRALVLASDGLWDVLTLERVAHYLDHTAKSADLLATLIADAAENDDNDGAGGAAEAAVRSILTVTPRDRCGVFLRRNLPPTCRKSASDC